MAAFVATKRSTDFDSTSSPLAESKTPDFVERRKRPSLLSHPDVLPTLTPPKVGHLSLLPMPAEDVPVEVKLPIADELPSDFRDEKRVTVALRAWVMTLSGSKRGFVTDLSEGGACVGGVGVAFQIGERVLLKVQLSNAEAPVVIRAEVIRYHGCEPGFSPSAGAPLGLRFIDINLDEWFRVARYLDGYAKRTRRQNA